MRLKTALLAALFVSAAAPAMAVDTVTYTEDFDVDFAGWKSRWFGANSNALPYNPLNPAERGNNVTGWTAYDGEFAPDGTYNSTRVDIRFGKSFAARLQSFSFDVLSYNSQRLEFYDLAGNVIFTQQLAPVDGPPFDFADSKYTRFTVTSANGIAGFSLLPFGSEGNVSFDDLVAVAAVPEPSAWLSMILGFGFAGGALRSRRSIRQAVRA
jgi:hypothetical protein